jgi:hypothetical protein
MSGPQGGPITMRLQPELEASLRRLPGVRAARVVTTGSGQPTEIHLLAGREKAAKQLVRDVQSLAMAEFDLEVDHRIISVVQLDSEDHEELAAATVTAAAADDREPPPAPPARPVVAGIRVESTGLHTDASVRLSVGAAVVEGTSRAPSGPASRARLIARAALDAVSLLAPIDACEIESADVVAVGGRDVAVCVVQLVDGSGEQLVSGSAVVRNDPAEAVVRAVLDALNRRLTG